MPHLEHVVKLRQLPFDLLKPRLVGDEQQHAAGRPVADGHTEDRVEVESAPREQPGDVRHRAGMIPHPQLEHHLAGVWRSVTYHVTLCCVGSGFGCGITLGRFVRWPREEGG